MDWGLDLPDGLDSLGDHLLGLDIHHLDINHDGIPESMNGVIDINHDGIPESMGGVIDINHDGIPESMGGVIDFNHDGIPEGSMGLDHLDSFLHADHAGIEPSTVASAVSAMHFPDPFADPVGP